MNRKPANAGFTLVELAIALVISVLLMCGILSVFAGIERDHIRLSKFDCKVKSDHSQIIKLLTSDLSGASYFVSDGKSISLQTNHSFDSELRSIDRPSIVTYFIEDSNRVHCLVRRHKFMDDFALSPPSVNLVAFNVKNIDVNELQSVSIESSAKPGNLLPISCRRLLVVIDFENPTMKLDQIICLP